MGGQCRLDALLIAVGSPHPMANRVAALAGIPPLGIAYLGGTLRKRGLAVRLIDLNVPGWSRDRLRHMIESERPKIVGLSCATESYRNAIRLGSWLRSVDREIRIVVGGPHVTFEDRQALRTGAFDVIVRGEGERTVEELFPRLVSGSSPDDRIRGITYRDGRGEIVRAPARPPIADLDSLPLPARDLLPLHRYGAPGAILTGRGCPGRCLFCAASAMSGGRYRVRHEESVMREMSLLRAAGIREILFVDDTLTGDRPRLERLLTLMERGKTRFEWACESRIEAVDAPLLKRMARCGCHSIQYGIESVSALTQRIVGKGAAAGGVESIIRATHRAGIMPVLSFIIGLPWEDDRAIRETISFAVRLQREYLARIGFGILVCYPGTPFWKRGEKWGIRRVVRDFDDYCMFVPTCETPHLDLEAQRSLYYQANLEQIRSVPRELFELSRKVERWVGSVDAEVRNGWLTGQKRPG
jgi:anaerobic magnesium-protoporphyrin IX monomethyl ester cyclase